jgi:DNA-binding transcriptional ArsR family regulator
MGVIMEKFLEILKALSDENRFKIITFLLTRNFCVRALANRLEISEAAVSQHLKILREAGLVKGEKRGYWVHYIVNKDIINQTGDELKKILEPSVFIDNHEKKQCCRKEENKDV